ncbi:Oidioi.mRNA.OKI2018_I69.chr2.g4482.t1.cds [Oikopleura dioica]|uniref:Oidioi.mRNA.OKI2018_I69.chr2.g4482.t1.cds n=1 Tax=Oikopleura dioica TaxID=34765 RepID=A0ABN7T430_OIKDI|nr:Oidioi.mRNA.OKI2018_I69.chr2.g4482.t1.cds [Oikopleura dioica]
MDQFIRDLQNHGVPEEKKEEEKPPEETTESKVDRAISCPECRERLKRPILMLPCAHNLCQKCAQNIFDNKAIVMRNARSDRHKIRCPCCRKEVVLDMHGIHGLTRNLVIEQFIETFEKHEKLKKSGKTLPPPRSRKTVALKYIPPSCKTHKNQKLNIYCNDCSELTCTLCKCFGAHKNCHVTVVKDSFQLEKEELEKSLDRSKNILKELREICKLYEEALKTSRNLQLSENQRILNAFHEIFEILEKRKKALLKSIDNEAKSKLTNLDNNLEQYGEILSSQTEILTESSRISGAKNWVGFIFRVKNDLIPKIDKFCDRREQVMTLKKVPFNEDSWKLNVEPVLSLINKIDFE